MGIALAANLRLEVAGPRGHPQALLQELPPQSETQPPRGSVPAVSVSTAPKRQ